MFDKHFRRIFSLAVQWCRQFSRNFSFSPLKSKKRVTSKKFIFNVLLISRSKAGHFFTSEGIFSKECPRCFVHECIIYCCIYFLIIYCCKIRLIKIMVYLVATSRRSEEKRVSLRRLYHGDHEGSSGGIYSLLY